jgi:DNA-binding IclR family transcriptional regulator
MGQRAAPPSVLGRAVRLLGAFGPDDAEVGLSELARRAGLPKASAHRLAEQLTAEGLLERAGPRYRLGLRLFELGQLVPRRRLLREAALPFLEDVFIATRETVHLAVPDGMEVLYVERLSGHRSGDTPSRVAGRLPLHCTATGQAMLAHSPAEVFEALVARPLERRTPRTIVVPSVLAAELAQVRSRGWAYERDQTRLGYASVASPVFGPRDEVLGALSVTGPDRRIDPERIAPVVTTAARGLSRTLAEGAPPGARR